MNQTTNTPANKESLTSNHSRDYKDQSSVYPVISRRAQGLSLGINLSPSGFCNYKCQYCFVDRNESMRPESAEVLDCMYEELKSTFDSIKNESIWNESRFESTPKDWRVLKDITIAGNGEPTASTIFESSLRLAIKFRNEYSPQTPILIMTNGTKLHLSQTKKAINLIKKQDKLLIKLDAGEKYLHLVNGIQFPSELLFENIINSSQDYQVVIQTLLYRSKEINHEEYIEDYLNTLKDLKTKGMNICEIQIHSLARTPVGDAKLVGIELSELQEIISKAGEIFPHAELTLPALP